MSRMEQQRSQLGTADGAPHKRQRLAAKDRRRQLILAAIQVFAQKGFRGTTTKEIAAAAGVAEAMIYRHFATKEDLYSAILDYQAEQIDTEAWLGELKEYAQKRDDEGLFITVAKRVFLQYQGGREFLSLMLRSALEGHELAPKFLRRQILPLHSYLVRYVIERQREGAFRQCDAEAAVRAFEGMLNHCGMVNELFDSEILGVSPEAVVSTFTDIFLHGIELPEGEKAQSI